MRLRQLLPLVFLSPLLSCGGPSSYDAASAADVSSRPVMRWDFRPEAPRWTSATLTAIRRDGDALTGTTPSDIRRFCPRYVRASDADRRAFWAGLLSALAKHESTWQPQAAGGGGRWIGLLQISPGTARAYGCRATTPAQLKDGSANLSCGVRIASAQVARDGQIVGGPSGWRGMARDWAPFRSPAKVDDMAAWTRTQSYCR